jgi:hypothetical protein
MWYFVLGLGLLALLGIAVLPVPRVRRLLLTGLVRLGQAITLAFLGACGTFFVQPQDAPGWASPLIEGTLEYLPTDTAPGVPWLAVAVAAVAVALPMLILVELAANISGQKALVQSLRKEVRGAARWLDARLTAFGINGPRYPLPPNEGTYATEALRSAGLTNNTAPAPLVLDLVK